MPSPAPTVNRCALRRRSRATSQTRSTTSRTQDLLDDVLGRDRRGDAGGEPVEAAASSPRTKGGAGSGRASWKHFEPTIRVSAM